MSLGADGAVVSARPPKPKAGLVVAAAFAVIVLSLNEYQLFIQLHDHDGPELIGVVRGVLDGHPPWRAFQARLLGPLAFTGFEQAQQWLQHAAPAFYALFERAFSQPDTRSLVAFNAFACAMILAGNLICFGLLLRLTGSAVKAAAGAVLTALLFILLSDHWLYTWDFFEVIVFTCLAYIQFARRGIGPAFLLLFLVALANRESAAFFGVWLLCEALCAAWIERRWRWGLAMLGLALVIGAVAYVMALRGLLLVESTLGHETGGPLTVAPVGEGGAAIHQAFGNHLLIAANALQFLKNVISPRLYVDVYLLLIVGLGLFLIRLGAKRADARLASIGLFSLFLIGSVTTFALLNETRLYLICMPTVVFATVCLSPRWIAALARLDRKGINEQGAIAEGRAPQAGVLGAAFTAVGGGPLRPAKQ